MPFNTQPPYNVQTVEDVTASRAWNTNYTNSTSRTMFVLVITQFSINLAGGQAIVTLQVPHTTILGNVGIMNGLLNEVKYIPILMIVKPGATYRISDGSVNGTASISKWIEMY